MATDCVCARAESPTATACVRGVVAPRPTATAWEPEVAAPLPMAVLPPVASAPEPTAVESVAGAFALQPTAVPSVAPETTARAPTATLRSPAVPEVPATDCGPTATEFAAGAVPADQPPVSTRGAGPG